MKKLRRALRHRILAAFKKVLSAEEMQVFLKENSDTYSPALANAPRYLPSPYLERRSTNPSIKPVLIISARFRTGSTMFWNILRSKPSNTAYYEPLHPRLGQQSTLHETPVDSTHANVNSYWDEYKAVKNIHSLYRLRWHTDNLYMDENHYDHDLVRYCDALIDAAPEYAILQFNRIDFRIKWFRKHFPQAQFLHLYRNPRDQWLSTLKDPENKMPYDIRVKDFATYDNYFLKIWCMDLSEHFGFLKYDDDKYAYDLFYLIWRLSYIYGKSDADYSLCFEDLVRNPEQSFAELTSSIKMPQVDSEILRSLNSDVLNKSDELAAASWYAEREHVCEEIIALFFKTSVPSI